MASASSSFAGTENPLSEGGVWTIPTAHFSGMRKANGAGVANNAGADCAAIYGGATFSANQFSEIVLASVPAPTTTLWFHYCNVRMNATASMYQVTTSADTGLNHLQLFKVNNSGTFTQIGANIVLGSNMAAGDVMRLSVVGTTLTVIYNGVVVRTATDSTLTTGQPGIGGWTQDSGSDVPFIASWNAADITASLAPTMRLHRALYEM